MLGNMLTCYKHAYMTISLLDWLCLQCIWHLSIDIKEHSCCYIMYLIIRIRVFENYTQSREEIIEMRFACLPHRPPAHNIYVWAIKYLCIDGLPYNLILIWSSSRRCTVTLPWVYASKLKVTRNIQRSEYTGKCLGCNLVMHWWITM